MAKSRLSLYIRTDLIEYLDRARGDYVSQSKFVEGMLEQYFIRNDGGKEDEFPGLESMLHKLEDRTHEGVCDCCGVTATVSVHPSGIGSRNSRFHICNKCVFTMSAIRLVGH